MTNKLNEGMETDVPNSNLPKSESKFLFERSYLLMLHSIELHQFTPVEVTIPCNGIPSHSEILSTLYHTIDKNYPQLKGYTLIGLNLTGVTKL